MVEDLQSLSSQGSLCLIFPEQLVGKDVSSRYEHRGMGETLSKLRWYHELSSLLTGVFLCFYDRIRTSK